MRVLPILAESLRWHFYTGDNLHDYDVICDSRSVLARNRMPFTIQTTSEPHRECGNRGASVRDFVFRCNSEVLQIGDHLFGR